MVIEIGVRGGISQFLYTIGLEKSRGFRVVTAYDMRTASRTQPVRKGNLSSSVQDKGEEGSGMAASSSLRNCARTGGLLIRWNAAVERAQPVVVTPAATTSCASS